MAYSVETYIEVGIIVELERKFDNLKPLVHYYKHWEVEVRRALSDPVYGQQLLKEIQDKLEDLRVDMENIANAVGILSGEVK